MSGATLGIVGLGRIGKAVARRARGFEMRLLYAKRERLPEAEERELGRRVPRPRRSPRGRRTSSPCTSRSDGRTEQLFDARRDSGCSATARASSTPRAGAIVDEQALVEELVAGRIRAGLDVFTDEPNVPPELLDLPNVVLTPHLGSATQETREAMTRVLVDNLLAAEAGRPLPNPVYAS